jgi:hypothetical protein
VGTKITKARKYKGSPPNLHLQSWEKSLLARDGGAIYDWFLELISGGSFAMPGHDSAFCHLIEQKIFHKIFALFGKFFQTCWMDNFLFCP